MQTFLLIAAVGVLGLLAAAGGLALLTAAVSSVVLALRWRRRPLLRRTQLALTALAGLAGSLLLILPVWCFGSVGVEIASAVLTAR